MISAAMFGGCGDNVGEPVIDVPGGDAERGRDLIVQYDCGACHTISGVEDADGLFGPPLTSWSARGYIAGNVSNEPEFLIDWIMDPQSIESGTAMPNLGVTRSQARDIAAYLYTLE